MASIWRLQLRPGAFRGVKFYCDRHDFEGGRRIVDHVFPYKEDPYTEDFGRKQRIYRLNAYVLGDDYFPQRDALIEALEKGGPGILVHPYLGNKTVEAVDFSVSEARDDGGMALLSITFHETTRLAAPEGVADLLSRAKDAANSVQIAVARAFNAFNAPNTTSFVFESATALINAAAGVLFTASQGLPSGANKTSDLAFAVKNLKGNSRGLIQRPGVLSKALIDSTKLLTSTLSLRGILPEDNKGRVVVPKPNTTLGGGTLGAQKRGAFVPLIGYGNNLPATLTTTKSRRVEKQNQDLMRQLVVATALGEAVIVSTDTDYDTYQDALDQRDYLVENINSLLQDPTLADDVYDALQDLAAVAIQGIPNPKGEAPRLSRVYISDVTPSLVLAYDLYEDLLFESDIIARNRIKHPGFITPLTPLEVVAGD